MQSGETLLSTLIALGYTSLTIKYILTFLLQLYWNLVLLIFQYFFCYGLLIHFISWTHIFTAIYFSLLVIYFSRVLRKNTNEISSSRRGCELFPEAPPKALCICARNSQSLWARHSPHILWRSGCKLNSCTFKSKTSILPFVPIPLGISRACNTFLFNSINSIPPNNLCQTLQQCLTLTINSPSFSFSLN